MMNFFEQQARARSDSRRMAILFVLAVIAIIVAIDVVVLIALGGTHTQGHAGAARGSILLWSSVLVLATITLSSIYKIASLSSGGAAVARSLGATFVSPDTNNPRHRRLRNVVEEMAIASGVPVPQIFVLEQESGINAFAAGFSPADAAVTVTRGALDKLTRDELQGVIGHEFSHILNGDMRLNIRLMGLIFGILVLSVIGREVLNYTPRRSGRDSKDGGAIVMIAFALLIFGAIGVFFGRLIKASISRSREYLADASAVQFTRQNEGLANALKKAAGLTAGTKLQSVNGEEVAHMLFGDGVGYSSLFATHPPLFDRIKRLDPGFRPEELKQLTPQWDDPNYVSPIEEGIVTSDFAPPASVALTAAGVFAQAVRPSDDDYRAAAALHRALPEVWLAAVHDEQRAADAVMALLINDEPGVREKQLSLIASDWGAPRRVGVEALAQQRSALHAVQRLPLAALALPALRRRPRADLQRLMRTLLQLIQADGRIEPFEYCLGRMLRDQVTEALAPAARNPAGTRKLDDCREAIVILYSALAQQGSSDEAAARKAFQQGVAQVLPRVALNARLPNNWMQALDEALDQLDQLMPAGKQLLIEGMVAVLSADGRVTIEEAELLRVVCGALHCPLPPLLKDQVS
jgi:Zn-dependent protease with chaperone function